jgi:hypothetical protein
MIHIHTKSASSVAACPGDKIVHNACFKALACCNCISHHRVPILLLQVLYGLCNRSQHWCSAAAGLLSGVSQLGEAALQLEYSRRGRLWAPGAAATLSSRVAVKTHNKHNATIAVHTI